MNGSPEKDPRAADDPGGEHAPRSGPARGWRRLLTAGPLATGLPELLDAIATAWQDETRATEVLVAWRAPDRQTAWLHRARTAAPPSFVERSALDPHVPLADRIRAEVSRGAAETNGEGGDWMLHALRVAGLDDALSTDDPALRGVVARRGVAPCDSGELLDELATLGAALLERLVPRDADAVRGDPGRIAALAEFAAGAGHEINNPLATISGRAQLLLRGETDPERRHALAVIGGQALRIRDMIGDLMVFARPPAPRVGPLDLSQAVPQIVAAVLESLGAPPDRVKCVAAERTVVSADAAQFAVVLEALVRNAVEACRAGEPIAVQASRLEEDGRTWGVVVVRDAGPGLSDLDRRHLFDPFYSGRQAGRGLGFGLCKAWRIVQQHGGRLEVVSRARVGDRSSHATEFRTLWPSG